MIAAEQNCRNQAAKNTAIDSKTTFPDFEDGKNIVGITVPLKYDIVYNSTKAAEALHMTQPAVSLAIKELEQYYGVHLFDRIGRRLQITDAGQHFLQYAIHISDLFSDMEMGLPHRMILPAIERGLVVTIGVKGLRFQRNFYMIHHKDKFLTASTKRFMELCRNYEVDYPFPRYNGLF